MLILSGDFGLGILINFGTVKTLRTLGDGQNAFCIKRWTGEFGGQG
jgi:hypothetical protein